MILFIIFGIFTLANAETFTPIEGDWRLMKAEPVLQFSSAPALGLATVRLGSIDVKVGAGSEIPFKYQPLSPQDQMASARSLVLANQVVKGIPIGVAGLPRLDPFYLDKIPPIKTADHFLARGKIYVTNIHASGIKNTEINNIENRLANNRFDISLYLPSLFVEVDYEADLTEGVLPITYSGHLSVMLRGLNLVSELNIVKKQYQGEIVYQVDGHQSTAHVDDVEVSIDETVWAFLGGAQLSAKEVIEQVIPGVQENVIAVVNNILAQYPAQDLLQYLLRP